MVSVAVGDGEYLAVDPGETIGWALFTKAGEPVGFGEVKGREALLQLLKTDRFAAVQHIIIEDYKIFSHKAMAHGGSKVETTRVIGAVEAWASMQDRTIKISLQPSSILPIAQKWSGVKVPAHGRAGHDQWSAYNHGYYYLVKNRVIGLAI